MITDTGATGFLDLDALDATPLQRDPFDYISVPGFLYPERLTDVIRDFPATDKPGNRSPDELDSGPAFAALVDELFSPALVDALSRKFGVDLSECVPNLTVRTRCEPSDGHIHPDHWTKVLTALIYPNEKWEPEAGRLRLLRSADDLESHVIEVPPEGGNLLAFRRCDHSFHGHHRHEGPRNLMQLSWVRPSRVARSVQALTRLGTRLMKSLGLHKT